MDRMKLYLFNNPRIKRTYVCKDCKSFVFFTSLTGIEAHMRVVHGQQHRALLLCECTQMDRTTFLGQHKKLL